MSGKDLILESQVASSDETRLDHPGHLGHVLSGSSWSAPLYKISGSDPHTTSGHDQSDVKCA